MPDRSTRRPCPSCRCAVPTYYLTGPGCWDCCQPRGRPARAGRRWDVPDDAQPSARPTPRAATLPTTLPADVLAGLTRRQRDTYAAAVAGMTAAAIARRDGVTPAAVSKLLAKVERAAVGRGG